MSEVAVSPPEVPTVSMSSTKKDLLEAYETAKGVLEAQARSLLKAEEARARAEKEAARVAADAQTREDPVRRLNDLRMDVGKKLNELAEKLEAEAETYGRVKRAVGEKEAELKQLYEIEAAAEDLAALLEAQRARKEAFDAEMARRREELESQLAARKGELEGEIAATRKGWKEEKARREAEAAEEQERIAKGREREEEEYDYALTRERAQRRNVLDDELAALERETASRRAAFAAETAAKESEFRQREAALAAVGDELHQLRGKVEGFPGEMAREVQKAVDEATGRLNAGFRAQTTLLEAQFKGEKNVLLSRIEALESRVESQKAHIVALEEKQEKAYEKVQDIANRAVEAARREVITLPLRTPVEGAGK